MASKKTYFFDFTIFVFIFLFVSFVFLLSIKDNFVSSVERGRYALTRSIFEDKTLTIDKYKDFSAPDLSQRNGHYYSRFPAGMSFMMLPAQLVTKKLYPGKPFVIDFAILAIIGASTIALFYILGRLGDFSQGLSSAVAISLAFSTLIFAYTGGFWSHIISLLFITMSIISFLIFYRQRNLFAVFLFSIFYGLCVSVDFPNAIILSPLFISILILLAKGSKKRLFSGIILILTPLLIIGSLVLFYNKNAFGSPFKIGQSAGASVGSTFNETIIPLKTWNAQGVFDDRRLFPGIFSQTLSPERGLIVFSPVLLLGLFGFILFYKKDKRLSLILFSIFALNISFYSIWQDYWGGWSWGPRYLIASIPAFILPLLYLLKYNTKKILTEFLFYLSVIFGIFINTLGAFTGSILPCPCEGYTGIWYSPLYAIQRLGNVAPNSFFYRNFPVDKPDPYIVFLLIFGSISFFVLILSFIAFRKEFGNEAKF